MIDYCTQFRSRWPKAIVLLLFLVTGCDPTHYNLRPHGDYHTLYRLTVEAEKAYAGQQWNLAQQHYLELSRLTPADSSIWLRLGNSYAQLGALALSQTAFETAIRLQPQAVKPRYNLATVHLLSAQNALSQIVYGLPIDGQTNSQISAKLRKVQTLLELPFNSDKPK